MNATFLEKFVSLLEQRQGQTCRELCDAIEYNTPNGSREISRLVSLGKLFVAKASPNVRYFSTRAEMEAMREQVDADTKAHHEVMAVKYKERHGRYNKRRAAEKKIGMPPRVPKPKAIKVKPPKVPKPIKFAEPRVRKAEAKRDDRPVVIPDHVKVQVLPGFTGAPRWAMGKTWQ